MVRVQLVFVFLALFCGLLKAQTAISGKLLDNNKLPISNVSVSYKRVGSVLILGYSKSNSDGSFTLESNANDGDSLQLDFSHLGYVKQSVIVANKTAEYTFSLKGHVRNIEPIKVENPPIFKRKDTVNYNVDAFTSTNDRVIADIIEKLPGIIIDGDEIFYQGTPIQKFMVNNLDLMEGRYSIINNNLPAEAVKNVQIVENDQPVKILDSLVFSDRASLNLQLKKITRTGSGHVGIGGAPFLWDVNLTPMLFTKNFQMLNSFQSNNIGKDLSQNLQSFYRGSGDYFFNKSSIAREPSLLNLREITSPGFEERKWLDNQSFLFSTNVLQKLNNHLQLKGNVSYYDDVRFRTGFTTTQLFAADEIIVSEESLDNRYHVNNLSVGVVLEKNETDIFFKNIFHYQKRWESDRGDVLLNINEPIRQNRLYTDEALMNSLSVGRFIGKQLVNISSNIEWHRTPQRLRVAPGQFEDLLNNSEPYASVKQVVNKDHLDWNNSVGISYRIKMLRFSPTVSINYRRMHLNTDIERTKDRVVEIVGTEFHNNMLNSQFQLAFDIGVGWETHKWKLNLRTPYSVRYFNLNQQEEKILDNVVRNTFNPRANILYQANNNNDISFKISGGRELGGLDNLYNGFIISDYRNIQRYEGRILGTRNFDSEIGYNYKNTLRARFAHVRYGVTRSSRDYIYKTEVDSSGRLRTVIGDRGSESLSHTISASDSRFFPKIKTVVKLSGNTVWSESDFLVNEVMMRQKTFSYGGTVEIINNLSSLIGVEYKTKIGKSINRLVARSTNLFYNNHFLSLYVYPIENHTMIINNSFYHNNVTGQKDQYFLDAVYRFTVGKKKIDIELSAQNLLNNGDYLQQFTGNYEYVQTSFELRPRQFMIATKFSF